MVKEGLLLMLKIVIINGQNHKGSTYHLGKQLVDHISCDKAITGFFLPNDLPHFCVGCYSCIEDETKCPYYKEKWKIMQKVEEADLLIFTTPNYCMAPSAPMKAFMDLTFKYWVSHTPRQCMFNKKAVVISTTAGMGANKAIKPISRMLFYWGVPWVKTYGIGVQAMNWASVTPKKKEKINRDMLTLAKKLSTYKQPVVPLKTKLIFFIMRAMQKKNMGGGLTEKVYWQKQGWLDKKRPWKQ